ncbi:MAG: helix-turn-helix transcriptional regulator [Acidaminococcaceae bacterium]|nr:helix-turn-helix transcriptional regulator [Acidaminococcaceae bacterium]
MKNSEETTLGEKLRILREELHCTQKEIAEKIHVERATYSFYENNSRLPSYEKLIMLADLFNVSIDYLIGRTDRFSPSSFDINLDEKKLLLRYRNLNDNQKNMLSDLIDIWEKRNKE